MTSGGSFYLGRYLSQDAIDDLRILPSAQPTKPKFKPQPYAKKDKRSPRFNDDEAAWRKEQDT